MSNNRYWKVIWLIITGMNSTKVLLPNAGIDVNYEKRYDDFCPGCTDGCCLIFQVEESPHSTEHDTGEYPDRGNLVERATETNRLETGKGAIVV